MIEIVRRHWEPENLFGAMRSERIPDRSALLETRRVKLWKDTFAEYDARHLDQEIRRRSVVQTEDGVAFLDAWAADERRHTRGFVRLLDLTAGVSPEESWAALGERKADFRDLDMWLRDEFTAVLVIAFDEIVTCHAYAADRRFYKDLGHEAYMNWFRWLIADEAAHYRNAVEVIRACHAQRIDEAPLLLDQLTQVRRADDYQATFVLDHFGQDYSTEMLLRCKDLVLRALRRSASDSHEDEYSLIGAISETN